MLAFVFALAMSGNVAAAEPKPPARPAAEAAEAALELYEAGRYDEARAEIARAYMIEPWPEYLFARAQIERADGDCVAAREFYRLYLDADPPERGAQLANEGIEACPVQPPPPRPTPSDIDAPGAKPKVIRTVGIVATATGGASLVVATALYIASAVGRRHAEDAASHGEFADDLDRAGRLGVAGTAMVSIGAILTTAGVVQLAIVARDRRGGKKRSSVARAR